MPPIIKALRWIVAVPAAYFVSTVIAKALMFVATLRPDLGHLTAIFGGQLCAGAAFGAAGVLIAPNQKRFAWILFTILGVIIGAFYFAKFSDLLGAFATVVYISSVALSGYYVYENSDEPTSTKLADRDPDAPLGSIENPVKCHDPSGERHYLDRLRDKKNFKGITYKRAGSISATSSKNLLDRYEISTSDGESHTIFFDMYHKKHVEMRPVPGFLIFNTLAGNPTIPVRTESTSLNQLTKIAKLVKKCVHRDFSSLRQIIDKPLSDDQCSEILSFAFVRYALAGNTSREAATKSLMVKTGLNENQASAVYTYMLGE